MMKVGYGLIWLTAWLSTKFILYKISLGAWNKESVGYIPASNNLKSLQYLCWIQHPYNEQMVMAWLLEFLDDWGCDSCKYTCSTITVFGWLLKILKLPEGITYDSHTWMIHYRNKWLNLVILLQFETSLTSYSLLRVFFCYFTVDYIVVDRWNQ